jgi:hypothetical protein
VSKSTLVVIGAVIGGLLAAWLSYRVLVGLVVEMYK